MVRIVAMVLVVLLATACAGRGPGRVRLGPGATGFAAGTLEGMAGELTAVVEREGRVPGAVLVVRRDGEVALVAWAGRTGPKDDPMAAPVDERTWFDVASLTKPIAGVTWVALAEGFSPPADRATQRLLLTHRAGLAQNPELEEVQRMGLGAVLDRATMRAHETRSRDPQGARDLYSNLGYMVLARMNERGVPAPDGSGPAEVSAGTIEAVALRGAWEAVGAGGMRWGGPGMAGVEASAVATSGRGRDGEWLRGEAADPMAAMWLATRPSVPFHAGLFARADDVAAWFDGLLCRGEGLGGAWARAADLMFGDATGRQALDDPTAVVWRTSGGLEAPQGAPFGADGGVPGRYLLQTGYTGCLVWIDTRSRTTLVLLTNATAGTSRDGWRPLAERLVRRLRRGIQE